MINFCQSTGRARWKATETEKEDNKERERKEITVELEKFARTLALIPS